MPTASLQHQRQGSDVLLSCGAVAHRKSGEVYLEGKLERGIVPQESVWEHGGGIGEEGCILYLHKMNLELLRRYISV